MKIVYISPTGNSKHLAIELAKKLNTEAVPTSKIDSINEDFVFMFSIHGFNPTRTAARFIKNLAPGDKKVHLLSVGCATAWVNEAVTVKMKRQLQKKGYSIGVDEVLAMPLTFVTSFPDEVIDKTINESYQKLDEIVSMIQDNRDSNRKIPFKSKAITFIGKAEDPAARLFGIELYANKTCTSCGICWNMCPEDNIKENKKGKPSFGFKCMMCMKCMYDCPEQSIKPFISRFLLQKPAYNIKNHIKKDTPN